MDESEEFDKYRIKAVLAVSWVTFSPVVQNTPSEVGFDITMLLMGPMALL